MLLHIETATKVCSVALSKAGKLISIKNNTVGNKHAEMLTVLIQEVMNEGGISWDELDAITVSKGPGSYTGLRIGVSVAKGLCYALDKPLIGIETLYSMANLFAQSLPEEDKNVLLCPMIDARRMEVYTALWEGKKGIGYKGIGLNIVKEVSAEIITENSFAEILKERKIIFFGDGAAKCSSVFANQPNAIIKDDFLISAEGMIEPALLAFNEKRYEDVAYFEPYYLKEFV